MYTLRKSDYPENYLTFNGELNVSFFDSPEDYSEFLKSIPINRQSIGSIGFRGHTFKDALDLLANGYMIHYDRAKSIIDKLEVSDMLTNNVQVLETSIAGFVPNVAAYLSGSPETMFCLEDIEQPNIAAPIRIFIEVNASAGITTEKMVNRGVAIVAFVMAMNCIRPVELYAVSCNMDDICFCTYATVVKIPSGPIDMARALYMLAEPSYYRSLGQSAIQFMSDSVMYSGQHGFNVGRSEKIYSEYARQMLRCEPNDMYIKGASLKDSKVYLDPIGWVNDMVKQHSGKI